jgi:alkylation response protein AidB-like acyl-CoA dehydrogenase
MNYGVAQERDWNVLGDEEFRAIVREELANHPDHLRFPPRRLYWSEQADWYRRMAAKGWIAPAWPTEFGGMGLDPTKHLILLEEQEHAGIARYQDHGVLTVGPILMRFGTEGQQRRFLPGILSCDERWVQGYSEPEAGSDLASLRTVAVVDDAHIVINGQKIWTTMAHDATHMFMLARTNPSAKKQDGISFILLELSTPGVTVRPIRDIAGHEELCEVFMDNVRTSRDNLVGEINAGWSIAKSLLGFERIHVGSPKLPEHGLHQLIALAAENGALSDASFVDELTQVQLDVDGLVDVYQHFTGIVSRGEQLGDDVSMLKLWATETFQRIADLGLRAAGDQCGTSEIALGTLYKALPAIIYAGSNEIQRNIIATRVLGLPR